MNDPQMNDLQMNTLGHTRTRVTQNHAFIAPDGHVETFLPGWKDTQATLLISPQMGARFTQYLAQLQPGGEGTPPLPGVERFVFVLSGKLEITTETETFALESSGYAYLPTGKPHLLRASEPTRLNVFERRFLQTEDEQPLPLIVGNADGKETRCDLGVVLAEILDPNSESILEEAHCLFELLVSTEHNGHVILDIGHIQVVLSL